MTALARCGRFAGGARASSTSSRPDVAPARARSSRGDSRSPGGARSAAPPAGHPHRSRPPAPTRRKGSTAPGRRPDRGAGSRAPPDGAAPRRAPVVLAPGRLERLGARWRTLDPVRRQVNGAGRFQGNVRRHLLVGRERVALLEVLPGPHVDGLDVVDLHVGALERQLVLPQGILKSTTGVCWLVFLPSISRPRTRGLS